MTFAHVFTSPLQRASRTCELAGFGAAPQVDADLVEWNYGDYEGKTTAEIRKERPGWHLFRDGCPGGESVADHRCPRRSGHRPAAGIDGDVLLFSSGHFLRVLAARWLELEASVGPLFLPRHRDAEHPGLRARQGRAGPAPLERRPARGRINGGERWRFPPWRASRPPKELLVDVAQLEREYYDRKPDLGDPNQLVSSAPAAIAARRCDGTFTEAHILAITQAICDYRRSQGIDGPLYMGKDTHALSGPAQRTALEVLAANGVETIIQRDDGVTPTPVISRAILVYNRGRKEHLADGIVITPSHNPPEDGGFKYNPTNGGPADTDVTNWIQDRANDLLRAGNAGVKRVPFATALKAATTHQEDFILPYVNDLRNVIDMDAIRAAGLKLGVDPLGGAARPLLGADQRHLRARTSPSSTRRSIRPSRS